MRKFSSVLLAASMTIFSAASANSQTIGSAVSVDDRVTGNNSRSIRAASKVSANERIRANASGLGHFKFNDGTKLVVGPGTNIVLDQVVYNPNGSTFKKFVLKTGAGATRFISGNSNSSAYEIKTPVGTLGIRGTAFDFQHTSGRTFIMLVSGRIEFCNFSGVCETIRRKCDYIAVSRNGDISKPTQPRDGNFQRVDMIRFFPFMADETAIEQDFRLRTKTCGLSGGNPTQGFRGRTTSGGGDDTGPSDTGQDQ